MTAPIYSLGSLTEVERNLGRLPTLDRDNPFSRPPFSLTAAITAARGAGFWLSPDVLKPFCVHILKFTELTERGAVFEAKSYATGYHRELIAEREAFDLATKMGDWAKSYNSTPDELRVEASRQDFIARRMREMKVAEEKAAEEAVQARRRQAAEREWDEQRNRKG